MSSLRADFSFPTRYRLGCGRRAELPRLLRELGVARPLLVTDPGVRALPFSAELVAALEAEGLPAVVFDGVHGNPTGGDVEAAAALARASGADGVLALGGGSAIDCAKGVAIAATHDGGAFGHELAGGRWRGIDAARLLRVVAVPTTAGTGSEMARAAVILHEETQKKRILWHPALLPALVVADPETTVGLPRHLTAATGMDALSHALEAYSALGFHPMCDGIAVEALRLVRRSLVRACDHPTDLVARSEMLVAASMGAVAFEKGLGVLHAIAHPLGGLTNLHHGLLNAVLLPYVIRFNRKAIADSAERLARWLGLEGTGVDALLRWVLDLRALLGIPERLADLGVPAALADEVGRRALEDPSARSNPVPLTAESVARLVAAAIEGGEVG